MAGGRPGPRPEVRATLWWVLTFALWWLLVGSWSPWDALWGAVVATVVTVAAVAAGRRVAGTTSAGRPGELGSAALQVVLDFAVLVAALVTAVARGDRGPVGRTMTRETDAGGPDAAVRRGWITLVATWSPNAYVITVEESSGRALVHDLRPWRRSEEPV